MGGTARDLHDVPGGALARTLEVAIDRWLEHEHGSGFARGILDEVPRGRRADLLVGGEQDPDTVGLVGFEQRQGADGLDYAGLHVEDPGPAHAIALDRPGDAFESSYRPDGVDVSEKEHLRPIRAPLHDGTPAMLANACGRAEPGLHEFGGGARDSAAGLDVGAGRLHLHQRAYACDEVVGP